MGMLARYMMIDKATLDDLFTLKNGNALSQKLFELEETKKYQMYGIGKTWDALHFILTGVSASTPIYDNKLSEGIVGVHQFHFYKDGDDYITGTENTELSNIISAMENVNLKKILYSFDFNNPKNKEIYPNGIFEAPVDNLLKELEAVFQGMLKFYKSAFKNNHHILVSIL